MYTKHLLINIILCLVLLFGSIDSLAQISTISSWKPPYFTGKNVNVSVKADTAGLVNSLVLRNGIRDSAFRFHAGNIAKLQPVGLGISNTPGVYFVSADLVIDTATASSYLRSGRWYMIFVHPFDTAAHPDPVMSVIPVPAGAGRMQLTDTILNTFFDKLPADSINQRLDKMVSANASLKCDSGAQVSALKMAFILSHYRDSLAPLTQLTIVIDSLYNVPTPVIGADSLTKICIAEFKSQILDSTDASVDKVSLTNTQKRIFQTLLDTAGRTATIVYSRGFVKKLFLQQKKIDITGHIPAYTCRNYQIRANSRLFDQVVFLMQIPLNRVGK
jgi:hypothetical protein